MAYNLFFDTNALLNLQSYAFEEHFIISQKTLEEIELIKSSNIKDNDIKYRARKLAHLLDRKSRYYTVIVTTNDILNIISDFKLQVTNDTIILATAYFVNKSTPIIMVSDDINMKFMSRKIFNLPTMGINNQILVPGQDDYLGYKKVMLTDDEMNYFYNNLSDNSFKCLLNEYLLIYDNNNKLVDYRKWNGTSYMPLVYTQINNNFLGHIKPINEQQMLAFDMLQDRNSTIKILTGRFGSGKDFLMISNALYFVQKGDYDKIIWIRNPIQVANSREIGYLPGDMESKLLPYSMVLADHLGGEEGLNIQIAEDNIEIQHLGFIRGRDYKNSILLCSESENMTKEHIQLLIGRVGKGSTLWLNGDLKQTDSEIYRTNNGLLSAINKLKGHKNFGFVKLKYTERSETAAMADLLD